MAISVNSLPPPPDSSCFGEDPGLHMNAIDENILGETPMRLIDSSPPLAQGWEPVSWLLPTSSFLSLKIQVIYKNPILF